MTTMAPAAARVAILHDMVEEGWPSMDQMGHLLTAGLPAWLPGVEIAAVRHPLVRVTSRGPLASSRPACLADRLLNRMVLYPRRVRRSVSGRFDLYHVVDHSYAHLALELPPRSAIVSCHDIDAFRSIVSPPQERRDAVLRAMARRVLAGLRRARLIVCGSEAARDDLVRFRLAEPSRLRVVPNGIDPALLEAPSAAALDRARALVPPQRGVFDLLHVGNDIPRKRLDRLLETVARLRQRGGWVRLVRVGAPLRAETRARAQQLGVFDVVELAFVERDVLRAVYARCDAVLLPSDREGYGLPVIEAFAAGKPVVASDIPAIREIAGGLATLVAPDGAADWVAAVECVLSTPDPDGRLAAARRAYAASRTWNEHLRGLVPVYAEALGTVREAAR